MRKDLTGRKHFFENRSEECRAGDPDRNGLGDMAPGYIAKHLAEQGNYLEAVSASSFLQQVAGNAMQLLNL